MLFTYYAGFLTKHFEDDDMLNITNILLRNLELFSLLTSVILFIFNDIGRSLDGRRTLVES